MCLPTYAQKQYPEHLVKDFYKANELLIGFKNDSALSLLNNIIDSLEFYNALETPFGIRSQFRQAEALEKDHKDDIALQKLKAVKQLAKEKKVWDAYTNGAIILARLYEKIGLKDECLFELMEAKSALNTHAIDSLYPLFSIRYSSYHRIFGNQDTALYYANEVLRTAPKFNKIAEEGVGHMLLGMLVPRIPKRTRLMHYTKSAEIFKEIDDHAGYSYMIGSVAGWHYENLDYAKALQYNDTVIHAAHQFLEEGFDQHWPLSNAYKFRAEIFRKLNKQDSAWIYLQKGYQMELQYIHESNNEKVMAIQSTLNNQEKNQKIQEQAQALQKEKNQRKLFLGLSGLFILFSSILLYFYSRLKKANQRTKSQANLLSTANQDLKTSLEEQRVLQGEVHHRVKNNLQIIISLLDLQKEEITDHKIKADLDAMSNRIYSMAAIHEILYQHDTVAKVNLQEYVNNLCTHFSNFSLEEEKPIYTIAVGDQFFNLETCMPIGIMLTELVTNSLKYGRVKDKRLKILIGLQKNKDEYCLIYEDNGPGFQNERLEEREGGLGTYLLKSMSRQLNGYFESKNQDGASFKINFKEKNS